MPKDPELPTANVSGRNIRHAIETLEKQIAKAPVHKRQALEAELRKLRAEYTDLRRALDGAKG